MSPADEFTDLIRRARGDASSPSRYAVAKELLQAVRDRLTPEEAHFVEFRQQGMGRPRTRAGRAGRVTRVAGTRGVR